MRVRVLVRYRLKGKDAEKLSINCRIYSLITEVKHTPNYIFILTKNKKNPYSNLTKDISILIKVILVKPNVSVYASHIVWIIFYIYGRNRKLSSTSPGIQLSPLFLVFEQLLLNI